MNRWFHAVPCGLVFLSVLSAGCASGPQLPPYEPPELEPAQAAIVKGHGGTNVTVVDQAKVRGSRFQIGDFGGNKVVLTPGRHRLVVVVGAASTMSIGKSTHAFEADFQAGHTYKVGPDSMFDRDVVLYDETADRVVYAEDPEEDPDDDSDGDHD